MRTEQNTLPSVDRKFSAATWQLPLPGLTFRFQAPLEQHHCPRERERTDAIVCLCTQWVMLKCVLSWPMGSRATSLAQLSSSSSSLEAAGLFVAGVLFVRVVHYCKINQKNISMWAKLAQFRDLSSQCRTNYNQIKFVTVRPISNISLTRAGLQTKTTGCVFARRLIHTRCDEIMAFRFCVSGQNSCGLEQVDRCCCWSFSSCYFFRSSDKFCGKQRLTDC